MFKSRRRLAGLLLALAMTSIALLPSGASALEFPTRPVRIIVPSAPGGSIDLTARVVAKALGELWGGNVIVENKPGAAMVTGTAAAARAKNDGYTLLVAHNGAMSINPVAFSKLDYDPERDFIPVAMLNRIPMVVTVNARLEPKTIEGLVALARSKPGSLNHASGGLGSLLPSELLKAMAGLDYVEVPYGGAAQAATATMAGDTQLMISDLASVRAAVDSGRIRPLAVTSLRRSKLYPQLPTLNETVAPGYQTAIWIGLFAPSGTPDEIVEKIQRDVQKVLATSAVRGSIESNRGEVGSGRGDELKSAMQEETKRWRSLVRDRKLKLN